MVAPTRCFKSVWFFPTNVFILKLFFRFSIYFLLNILDAYDAVKQFLSVCTHQLLMYYSFMQMACENTKEKRFFKAYKINFELFSVILNYKTLLRAAAVKKNCGQWHQNLGIFKIKIQSFIYIHTNRQNQS